MLTERSDRNVFLATARSAGHQTGVEKLQNDHDLCGKHLKSIIQSAVEEKMDFSKTRTRRPSLR